MTNLYEDKRDFIVVGMVDLDMEFTRLSDSEVEQYA